MKNAIILHGTLGSPDGNWFRWLKKELEHHGFDTWLPTLPHATQPSLHEWGRFVRSNCPFPINSDTLIVGHSSGAILALILAQQNKEPIGGVVGVSVFHDNSLNWEPNNRLFDVAFAWGNISAHARRLLLVHSDNDPYVPLAQARFVAKRSGAELVVVPGEGHFNLEQSPDYKAFPKLLTILREKGFVA